MRKFLILGMALLAMVSCSKKDINALKDDVQDLKTRVTVLEELCKQNNTNITSLQTVVNTSTTGGDYVTAVAPITKDGEEIGYTISFKNQPSITIYNGKDGSNASAPIVSAKMYTDGAYYWTVDGEWLTDDMGNKLRVSGKDGNSTNGVTPQLKIEENKWYVSYDEGESWSYLSDSKGNDGVSPKLKIEANKWYVSYDEGKSWSYLSDSKGNDGITPQLKIEDEKWYVSTDKGVTWTYLAIAKGDKGEDGKDGDSMFKEVTQDEKNVYFTLADETVFTIAKLGNGEIPRVVITNGALPGEFSVSATKKVRFSRGNLRCLVATNEWSFALEQYMSNGFTNSAVTETRWVSMELFGWGTSGWNSGAVCYAPESISTIDADYKPGNSTTTSLVGEYAQADWGVYNSITNGGNKAGVWRTLTKEEWVYLIKNRANAANKKGLATIGYQTGLILLSDDFVQPINCIFHSGVANGYSTNIYSIQEWRYMEAAGAVFLPASGIRVGSGVINESEQGQYWSSSVASNGSAYLFVFSLNELAVVEHPKNRGRAVRLVQDVE